MFGELHHKSQAGSMKLSTNATVFARSSFTRSSGPPRISPRVSMVNRLHRARKSYINLFLHIIILVYAIPASSPLKHARNVARALFPQEKTPTDKQGKPVEGIFAHRFS